MFLLSSRTLSFAMACIFACMFISCKKEGCTDSTATNYDPNAKKDDGSCQYAQTNNTTTQPQPQPYNNHMSWTADGSAVTAGSTLLGGPTGYFQFQGFHPNGTFPQIAVLTDDTVNTGTYNITRDFDWEYKVSYLINTNNSDIYQCVGNSGTITISKHDYTNKIIEGTFSGTFYKDSNPSDSVVITNGSFGYQYN